MDGPNVNPLLDTERLRQLRRELADLERDYRHELLSVVERQMLRDEIGRLRRLASPGEGAGR